MKSRQMDLGESAKNVGNEELLRRITIVGDTSIEDALRAVVKLHKPMPSQFKEGAISCFECSTMDYDVYWNECPTIQAIEKELA